VEVEVKPWILALFAGLGVAGCGAQKAVVPDPGNPGHCIAAFNATAVIGRGSGSAKLVFMSDVRALFVAHKLDPSALARAKKDGMRLSKSGFAKSFDAIHKLATDCSRPLDQDDEFHRQLPALMEEARKLEQSYQR
jgi:hypothetical protein